jgi:hypothetical protein
MATDATGTATAVWGIPNLVTSQDAPSGLVINEQADAVELALNKVASKAVVMAVALGG